MGMHHKDNPTNGFCNASGTCGNFSNEGAQYCSKSSHNFTYNTSCAYYALMDKHPTQEGKNYWDDFI